MAVLRAAQRNRLPRSAFVYPSRRAYPIDTPARARNALARAAQRQTRGSYSTVAKAVRRRYGNRIASVGRARGTTARPGYRRGVAPRRRRGVAVRRGGARPAARTRRGGGRSTGRRMASTRTVSRRR